MDTPLEHALTHQFIAERLLQRGIDRNGNDRIKTKLGDDIRYDETRKVITICDQPVEIDSIRLKLAIDQVVVLHKADSDNAITATTATQTVNSASEGSHES